MDRNFPAPRLLLTWQLATIRICFFIKLTARNTRKFVANSQKSYQKLVTLAAWPTKPGETRIAKGQFHSLQNAFCSFKLWKDQHSVLKLLKNTQIFIFCPKIQLWFPEKIGDLFGWKTRENVVVLDFLAVDNFDFTRKIGKKYLGEKLVKMLGFCQNWIFGQKFDFSNSVKTYYLSFWNSKD